MCFVFNLLIVLYNLNVNLKGKFLQWAVNIINGAATYLELLNIYKKFQQLIILF